MNKFIKKVLVGFTAITITITSFGSSFAATPTFLHQDKNITQLSGGVTHEHIKQFHAKGWWNINVLRVDLDDEYTKVDTIFNNKGIAGTTTITNMMKDTKAIGAVNADFFSMASPSFPIGATISDGKVISSPKYNDGSNKPVFAIDKNNVPSASYWNWSMNLVAPTGNTLPVITINKDSGSQYHAVVFNDSWGGKTHNGKVADVVDMVITNNIVTEIRVSQPGIYVPSGSTVVHAKGPAKAFILSNFQVGSSANLQSAGGVNFDNYSTAVGAGDWLLKDGAKITVYDTNVGGNRPRTAVGITKDKKQIIMVTVDGTTGMFSGIDLPILTDIMKSLGAHDALNFDGGGSTTMAVKSRDDSQAKVVNLIGSQRSVSNGLAVFDTAPMGDLYRLELSTDNKNAFNNSSRTINVVGYDKYQHKIAVNANDVDFTVEGTEGSFENNKFIATSAGKAKIKASLNGAVGEIELNILDDLREIVFTNNKIGVDISGNRNIGEAYGIDSRGLKIKLDPSLMEWETIGDIGRVEKGVFYATDKPASGAIVARLNGVVKTIPVSIGLESKSVNNLDSLTGITTSSFPKDLVGGTVSLDSDAKVGSSSLKLNYDFTKTDKTRAFYTILGSGMKIAGEPSAIGLWINGNSDNTWVRGDMVDAKGVQYKLDFAKSVDWTGWKNMSANIPAGVTYPVTLQKIYLAQTDPNNKAMGSMKIDGISGMYTKNVTLDPSTVPVSSVYKDEYNVASPVLAGGHKFIVSDLANSQGFKVDTLGSATFIKVNNSPGGIRSSHPEQWLWMKSAIENSQGKNIVLMLPKSIYSFKDKMEQDIFHKLIKEYTASGKNMHVVYGSNKTAITTGSDGTKYFEVNSAQAASGFEFVVNGDKVTYQAR